MKSRSEFIVCFRSGQTIGIFVSPRIEHHQEVRIFGSALLPADTSRLFHARRYEHGWNSILGQTPHHQSNFPAPSSPAPSLIGLFLFKPERAIALSLLAFGVRADGPYFAEGAGVSMRGSISARVAAL
jgi:hypothetical protein